MSKRSSKVKHDALNHLNAILLSVQVLNVREDGDEFTQQYLQTIETAAAALQELIVTSLDAAPDGPAFLSAPTRLPPLFGDGRLVDGFPGSG